MTFYVGQKVTRISLGPVMIGKWIELYGPISHPDIGEVVTIRRVFEDGDTSILFFAEHDNTGNIRLMGACGGEEPGFPSSHFRPIVDRESSVSFTMGAPKDSERWDNRKRVKVRS